MHEIDELFGPIPDHADRADPGAARRRITMLAAKYPPFVFVGETTDPADVAAAGRRHHDAARPAASRIQGFPGCPGVSEGRARVVLDSHDPSALEPGDVLVAPITDPSWTPLFVRRRQVSSSTSAPR